MVFEKLSVRDTVSVKLIYMKTCSVIKHVLIQIKKGDNKKQVFALLYVLLYELCLNQNLFFYKLNE